MRRFAAPAAKLVLGRLAVAPGIARRTRRTLDGGANVVYLHYAGPRVPHLDAFYTGLDVERFDRALTRLARWFSFAPLSDVVAGTAPARDGRPPLAVTFDDGFDVSRSSMPEVLARHGVSATMFVITGCVGNRELMWRNKLSAILATAPERVEQPETLLANSRRWPMSRKDALADQLWARSGMPPLQEYLARHRPYLGWDGLRQWMAAGHTVGLHTRTHPDCSLLGPHEVEEEIVAPAEQLRAELGLRDVPLSYPFGARLASDAERRLVETGVISCALGIRGFAPLGTPPHRLERANVEEHMEWEVFGRSLVRSLRPSHVARGRALDAGRTGVDAAPARR